MRIICSLLCAALAGCAAVTPGTGGVATQPPNKLHYESRPLPSFETTIYEVAGGVMTKRGHGVAYDGREPHVEAQRRPTAAEWARFWQTMTELRIWQWKEQYYREGMDGHSWNFSCESGSRHMQSTGSNA